MKWVVLIYLMIIGVNEEPKYTRLEYPVIDWQECLEIEQQLNDIINRGHHSEIPFVRSMYWVYNNMLKEIRAECVHADPPVPVPKWMKKKRDWSIPPDHPMIPPE